MMCVREGRWSEGGERGKEGREEGRGGGESEGQWREGKSVTR